MSNTDKQTPLIESDKHTDMVITLSPNESYDGGAKKSYDVKSLSFDDIIYIIKRDTTNRQRIRIALKALIGTPFLLVGAVVGVYSISIYIIVTSIFDEMSKPFKALINKK